MCSIWFDSQIGGAEHAAEIHWVHVKEGTEDDLLVVGVLFDTSGYGSNVEVSKHVLVVRKCRSARGCYGTTIVANELLRRRVVWSFLSLLWWM